MRSLLHTRSVRRMLAFAVGGAIVAIPATSYAAFLRRLADFFPVGELFTAAPPPGVTIYDNSFTAGGPISTVYVTLEGVGDTHAGDALALQALVAAPKDSGPQLCSVLSGRDTGGGGPHEAPGWSTALILPADPAAKTQCSASGAGDGTGDGGGGPGDCHDNTVHFSCCFHVPTDGVLSGRVIIKMADLPGITATGGTAVFLEKAEVHVDTDQNPANCTTEGFTTDSAVVKKGHEKAK